MSDLGDYWEWIETTYAKTEPELILIYQKSNIFLAHSYKHILSQLLKHQQILKERNNNKKQWNRFFHSFVHVHLSQSMSHT